MTQPPATSYQKHPDAIAKDQVQRSEKSEATALEILRIAVESSKNNPTPLNNDQLCARAEMMWQWVTTDTWPPPPKGP